MSEYISFFIRRGQNNFIPLFTFSRNASIFQSFRYALPYERVRAISLNELEDKELECERRSDDVIKRIDRLKEDRALIASFNNSVDEKMDALQVSDAITEIFNVLRASNKYIDETTPWVLAKDENLKMNVARCILLQL